MSDSSRPLDYTVHGILQGRILRWVAVPFSRGSSQPGSQPGSPALQVDSLPAEPPGKPKNTGVGSLSLLQPICSTQELNQGLLHCRQILNQLSYQGNPAHDNVLSKYSEINMFVCLSLSQFICFLIFFLFVLKLYVSLNLEAYTSTNHGIIY